MSEKSGEQLEYEEIEALRAERDRLKEALETITAIDPAEWHEGSGWKCVEYIQRIAIAAQEEER